MLAWTPGVVVMAVTDSGGTVGIPEARQADDDATNGRGLALVHAIADRVDVLSTVTGRTVKAVLRYEEKELSAYV